MRQALVRALETIRCKIGVFLFGSPSLRHAAEGREYIQGLQAALSGETLAPRTHTADSVRAAFDLYGILGGLEYRAAYERSRTYPFKSCRCGEQYTAEQFTYLPHPIAGELMSDGYGGTLTLRNCPCKSTIAVPTAMMVKS